MVARAGRFASGLRRRCRPPRPSHPRGRSRSPARPGGGCCRRRPGSRPPRAARACGGAGPSPLRARGPWPRRRRARHRPAVATRRGSAVITPSTSDQISTRSASSAQPRTAAVRSEPPRPRSVVSPASVAPRKPVTTGTAPGPSAPRRPSRAGASRGSRPPPPRTPRRCGRARRRPACASRPRARRAASTTGTESRSPRASTPARAAGEAPPSAHRPRRPSSSAARSRTAAPARRAGLPGDTAASRARCRSRIADAKPDVEARGGGPARAASSASVTPDRAETTITTGRSRAAASAIPRAERRAGAVPTDVPPNLSTRLFRPPTCPPPVPCRSRRPSGTGPRARSWPRPRSGTRRARGARRAWRARRAGRRRQLLLLHRRVEHVGVDRDDEGRHPHRGRASRHPPRPRPTSWVSMAFVSVTYVLASKRSTSARPWWRSQPSTAKWSARASAENGPRLARLRYVHMAIRRATARPARAVAPG